MIQHERITAQATIVQDMAARVLSNGAESLRLEAPGAFRAAVRALLHDFDPRQVIQAIERETR